jgi:class 3 adenylate cyclase
MINPPETRYARNGAVHLAYQVIGEGPVNLVVVQSGPASHVDFMWMDRSLAESLRRLASFSRLVIYDNRGVGLSDPEPGGAAPTMDEQVDDVRAILDETGCDRAVLLGVLGGSAPALVFTAAHPERVESLILMGGYARVSAAPGYEEGVAQADIDGIAETVLSTWGTGADLPLTNPTMAGDDSFRQWYAQMQRMAASPATAAAMARQWFEVDVRSVLPAIRVPTLVIARTGNLLFPAHHTRYLADHIDGAKYAEFPGADLHYFVGDDANAVMATVEEFVTGMRPLPVLDRFLGTVLFVDVVGSTKLAAQIGDHRFRDLLDDFLELVRRQLDRYQGKLVDTAGDGALALFDSPARAIACAESIRDGVRALGLQIRAGVHTGEMERGPAGEVRGIAVHTGARVAALAGPGEILVSRTIRDLVAGSPIHLGSRGLHELKGVPGEWEIFEVS